MDSTRGLENLKLQVKQASQEKENTGSEEFRLKGLPICRGIAIGKPFFFHVAENDIPDFRIEKEHVEKEILRYKLAIQKTRDDISRLKSRLEKDEVIEAFQILDAQLQMTEDPLLTDEIELKIRTKLKNAESVFYELIGECGKRFELIQDPTFRERFKDIQDISRRIMSYLMERNLVSLSNIPPGSIVFAKELTTSDIAEANSAAAIAFVTHFGAIASHAAIIAKAKGIPYVTSIDFKSLESFQRSWIILDGRTGDLIINPEKKVLAAYKKLGRQLKNHQKNLDEMRHLPAATLDGHLLLLFANIEAAEEVEMMHRFGAEGVGLFRSEYAFISDRSFPDEEEQFKLYQKIVRKMKGLPIVIRTFDVGGDKFLANQLIAEESNPYLGCRAIRFLLKESEVFKVQLRAILRAAASGSVSIMFPMISSLQELLQAKAVLNEVKSDLLKKGEKIPKLIKVGCMIEVPSAAIISDLLAKECDFLSIGTNDLVQYALAVDRSNHSLNNLYAPTHPSVLRLIKLIVQEADKQEIPVTVCGEIAADPLFTALLLGLGVHGLSVAARYIPIIKNAVRSTSLQAAKKLATKALSLRTAAEIEALLTKEYQKSVPDDTYYNV
ncbi:MAG TPA: phosphoenolpyruvate--protein phosphotransferase [Parachlamydiaceae bacterium]|nr:phosphoenolpyruvate--protein phosphotransferase [Parachlamydiaceae bacterium]